jgi:methyltransferase
MSGVGSVLYWIVGVVAVQRLGELWLSRRNTRRLLDQGGVEHGARHYPLIVAVHLAWLAALVLWVDAGTEPSWLFLVLYLALQLARVWILWSLGRFWTVRVITLRDAPLIRRGPYRFLRHPNYVVVSAEIAVLPLVFGAWELALGFTLANLAILRHRITVENAALAERA